MTSSQSNPDDVLALQTAMLIDGVYPGAGKTKNDCPRTGKLGPCTLSALNTFQKKYGIKGEEGMVGEKTKKILNTKYSVQSVI
jgi:peptidoglycan hydrolase-like protein with peptidoglycan-binding domain